MIPELEKLGCKYIPFEFDRRGMNPFADIKQVFRYIRLLQKKPNVVLTYTIKPTVYGGIACQTTKVPDIVNITGLGMTVENGGPLKWLSLCLYKIGIKCAKYVFSRIDIIKLFYYKEKLF